jgi:hypothetical protein
LIAALIAGAFALGSFAAMAADEDDPAYKMGMASQRQHDLPNNPPTTVAESKALQDAAMKARVAYASLSPEEKALYKKGMIHQRQMDLRLVGDFRSPNDPIYPMPPPFLPAPTSASKPPAGDATGPKP